MCCYNSAKEKTEKNKCITLCHRNWHIFSSREAIQAFLKTDSNKAGVFKLKSEQIQRTGIAPVSPYPHSEWGIQI